MDKVSSEKGKYIWKWFEICPDILSVQTNTTRLENFRFGVPSLPRISPPDHKPVVTVNYIIISNDTHPSIKGYSIPDYNNSEKIRVTLERPLFPGFKALISIERSANGQYSLIANTLYSAWSLLRITKHYPAPRILTSIAAVALLENGFAPIHCASVERDGKAIILLAPPDTGKTYTTQQLIEDGWKFISEDIAITDGVNIYGCPHTSTVDPEHNIGWLQSRYRRIEGSIFKRHRKLKLLDTLIPDQHSLMASIGQVFFLERDDPEVKEISKDDAINLALRLNRYEFRHPGEELLLTLWMKYGFPDLQKASVIEMEIFSKLMNTSISNFVVSSKTPEQYPELISSVLGHF